MDGCDQDGLSSDAVCVSGGGNKLNQMMSYISTSERSTNRDLQINMKLTRSRIRMYCE